MFQGTDSQRSLVLIGAALALPIVVLVVIQLSFAFSREREDVERRTLSQAQQIVQLTDARLESDLSLMELLASADQVERHSWSAARDRAREIAALNPHWRNVIVSDIADRREIFSLQAPESTQSRAINPAVQPEAAFVGHVTREGPGCPCVYLHMPIDSRYLLTVAIDPAVFQSILVEQAPQGSVSAIVDRNGMFVARSA